MTTSLPGLSSGEEELGPLTIIRTETALSRFPIHRLVKKGEVQIEIKNQDGALQWEVSYNSKYGQPGPLAYKLDTLVVNRRIEEAGRPVPELLRLGSLRDICRELGNSEGGESTQSVRRALMQNASAFINARMSYKAVDRTERTLEASFTRYSVIFTGEMLPDGRSADAVYLILNRPYIEVLNAALSRPLDFDYMRSLPPAAQRFYEIASYQIYAALHFGNECARLRYSEYCLLSTATRYPDFDHVKKQMYKVHKPHLDSGYLQKISYEATTDAAGAPDWWMVYVPGPNAAREYREFTGSVRRTGTGRGGKRTQPAPALLEEKSLFSPFPESLPAAETSAASKEPLEPPELVDPEVQALVDALTAMDLNRADAERLALTNAEECRRQLAFLPFVTEFKTSRGAYLRRAIEQGFAPPPAYLKQQQAKEAQNALRRKRGETEHQKAVKASQEAVEALEAARMEDELAQLKIEAPVAYQAFEAFVAAERQTFEAKFANMSAPLRERMTRIFDTPEKRRELYRKWQMDQTNPESSV